MKMKKGFEYRTSTATPYTGKTVPIKDLYGINRHFNDYLSSLKPKSLEDIYSDSMSAFKQYADSINKVKTYPILPTDPYLKNPKPKGKCPRCRDGLNFTGDCMKCGWNTRLEHDFLRDSMRYDWRAYMENVRQGSL